MARTNIKVFDEGYKNIMNDDEYNLSVQRTRGVTPGIADPLMHNKLYRQVSVMSTALAQYIVDQGYDCLDTDLAEIAGNIKNATIKTMLDRLKEGNLILGDGITANGNFTINRKLTVNEIDCKTGLTIGGQKPLDASALQKIQDQIIAPSQEIRVDSINGSDEAGDGTYGKPYKTLDKAVAMMKSQVPNIKIILANHTKNQIYTLSKTIEYSGSLGIESWNWQNASAYDPSDSRTIRPIISVGYSKGFCQWDFDGTPRYFWGNMLAITGQLYLAGIEIRFHDKHEGNRYSRFLVKVNKDITINACTIELGTYALWLSQSSGNTLSLGGRSIISSDYYLIIPSASGYNNDPSSLKDPTNYYFELKILVLAIQKQDLVKLTGQMTNHWYPDYITCLYKNI